MRDYSSLAHSLSDTYRCGGDQRVRYTACHDVTVVYHSCTEVIPVPIINKSSSKTGARLVYTCPMSKVPAHILLECKPLDIKRIRIFKGKQPGLEEDTDLGYKFLELAKFAGVGRQALT